MVSVERLLHRVVDGGRDSGFCVFSIRTHYAELLIGFQLFYKQLVSLHKMVKNASSPEAEILHVYVISHGEFDGEVGFALISLVCPFWG